MYIYKKKVRRPKNERGIDPMKRSDAMPIKLFTHEYIKKETERYLQNGGKIAKITEEDIKKSKFNAMGGVGGFESIEFLTGD